MSSAYKPWRIAAWTLAALLLVLPLAAMQVTDEVNWSPIDFVFAAVMIGGVGLAIELTIRKSRNNAYRAAIALLLAATFLLIWINAAVGIIGDEDDPLNLLYVGVLAVAYAGAIGAGFKSAGMSRALVATAIAQALVGAIAVKASGTEPPGALGQVAINGFFFALFGGSAWLFRKAAV